jgi:hypothetical protein
MKPCLIRALQVTLLLLPFCFLLAAQETEKSAVVPQQSHNDQKNIEITSVRLFGWQSVGNKRKYTELKEFRETKGLHLAPTAEFDAVCEVSGELGLSAGDFFLWTTVDFLIASVTQEYEKMETDQLGSNVGWGQDTTMHDLKAVPVYFLRAGETRRVVVKGFDLGKVLASFPVGDAGNLWPWLIRLNIHIQDRDGRQITSAERIVRLWPDSVRKPNP